MTLDDILNSWRRKLETGTQRDLALSLGVSQAYLSDMLLGKRKPGPKVLDKLGVEEVVTYRLTNPN